MHIGRSDVRVGDDRMDAIDGAVTVKLVVAKRDCI